MKLLKCIIGTSALDEVKDALSELGIAGMTSERRDSAARRATKRFTGVLSTNRFYAETQG